MGLFGTVSEKNGDFNRKSQICPTPWIYRPHWVGSPWNWVIPDGLKKLEWWATRRRKKFIGTDTDRRDHECDGQRDRQTDNGRQLIPRLRITSLRKNQSRNHFCHRLLFCTVTNHSSPVLLSPPLLPTSSRLLFYCQTTVQHFLSAPNLTYQKVPILYNLLSAWVSAPHINTLFMLNPAVTLGRLMFLCLYFFVLCVYFNVELFFLLYSLVSSFAFTQPCVCV